MVNILLNKVEEEVVLMVEHMNILLRAVYSIIFILFIIASVPSSISYRVTDFVWEQYTSAAETPVFYNELVNFKITPSKLPNGVQFESTGSFTGVAKETLPKTEYNITAETLDGDIVSLPITIEVTETCIISFIILI